MPGTAGPLQQVGSVQAGGVHSDQQLTFAGHRVGPFPDEQGACLDHDGAHRPDPREAGCGICCRQGGAPGAQGLSGPVGTGRDGRVHHVGAGLLRLHDHAAADVHDDVVKQVGVAEEDQVTRLQVGHRDVLDLVVLLGRPVGQRDAGLPPGPHGQPRAVEADAGRGTAPDVGDPALALSGVDGDLARALIRVARTASGTLKSRLRLPVADACWWWPPVTSRREPGPERGVGTACCWASASAAAFWAAAASSAAKAAAWARSTAATAAASWPLTWVSSWLSSAATAFS